MGGMEYTNKDFIDDLAVGVYDVAEMYCVRACRFRGLFELDINTMSAMSIALSPLILMSEMAPPAGVARAHIVSLFIIYIIYMYMYL